MQFFLLVQQGGMDGHVLRLCPCAQKRGLQEAGDRRDRAGGKAPGGASTNATSCPWRLCFVGWWVPSQGLTVGVSSGVSSLWILSSLWELSSLLKAFFQLCYSRVSLHHSDSFCSLTFWDITVSDTFCPTWLVSQSACSEVTHVKAGGLELDGFVSLF